MSSLIPRGGRPSRAVVAAGLALALLAAACGDAEPAAIDSTEVEPAPTSTQAPDLSEAEPVPTGDPAPEVSASDDGSMGASPRLPEPAPEPTPVPDSDLPSVELVDVASGATVNLASFAPSERPIVLWFWAPH